MKLDMLTIGISGALGILAFIGIFLLGGLANAVLIYIAIWAFNHAIHKIPYLVPYFAPWAGLKFTELLWMGIGIQAIEWIIRSSNLKNVGLNLTEESPIPWKIFYKEKDPLQGKNLNITIEGPDKAGVEELLKTVKKEMIK